MLAIVILVTVYALSHDDRSEDRGRRHIRR